MKNYSKYFVIIAIASVFLLFPKNNAQAACTLTNAFWSKQEVVIGEDVVLVAQGQGCRDREVSFNIYEQDPGLDDTIRTVKGRFTNDTNLSLSFRFTQADYNRGYELGEGDGDMYFEAVAFDANGNELSKKSSQGHQSGVLTLKAPGTSCEIKNALWETTTTAGNRAAIGETVYLKIDGTANCAGKQVNFNIYEKDTIDDDLYPKTLTAQFDSFQRFRVPWAVDGSWDDDLGIGDWIFYFKAHINGDASVIIRNSPPDLNVAVSGGGGGTAGGGTGGTGPAVCGNNKCESGETQSCPTDCKPGETQTYPFEITNPLKGGANDFTSLVKILAQWIFNLAIPIAVAMIVYSGILFLTAQGEPATVTKAKEVLKYAIIGLTIILIGSGFVTFIKSVLELGSSAPASNSGQPTLPTNNTGGTTGIVGEVGNKCSADRDCITGLKCQDSICKRPTGNWATEPCNSARNCDIGLTCDKSDSGLQPIDGQNLGTCSPDSSISGGQIGDVCERDSNCISGLKCNQICQRKEGNLIGELCVNTAPGGNCNSQACRTLGTDVVGTCVTN